MTTELETMIKELEIMMKDVQVAAAICNQWGDTGKGKISDLLAAYWADVIARGTGGNNAGHTTVINGVKRVFHLVPAGIIYDSQGKVNILGNGMVLDLDVLCEELNELDRERMPYNNLMISEDANVILPIHIAKDQIKNQSLKNGGIGSTGRGIGPCYADATARRGIFVRDLFNKDKLAKKLEKLKPEYEHIIDFNIDDIIGKITAHNDRLKPFVRNTIAEMHQFYRNKKKISIEGAQGLLLSIMFGTSPYVTSSDCSLDGTAAGVGLNAGAIDLPFGIVKFPYMTRVGNGPFPSEFGGDDSELYCADGLDHDIKFELNKYGIPFKEVKSGVKYDSQHENIIRMINSVDPFTKGVGIRLAGWEYGATTGRPRRTGWTDLVALKYATMINGPHVILTKPDVLRGADEFELVDSYEVDGNQIDFTRDCDTLRQVKTGTKKFKGFNEDISGMKKYEELPAGLKEACDYLEQFADARIRMVSVGANQSETIIK